LETSRCAIGCSLLEPRPTHDEVKQQRGALARFLKLPPEGCPYRKLEPDILMMQSTEDGPWSDTSDCVHGAQDRRVLRQR
jgi:hypothetical protein